MRILIAVALIAAPGLSVASEDESWDRWEAQQLMQGEMKRARELGGYSDPITAARNIANGTATEKDITDGYRKLYDLPEYGGPPVGGAPDQR